MVQVIETSASGYVQSTVDYHQPGLAAGRDQQTYCLEGSLQNARICRVASAADPHQQTVVLSPLLIHLPTHSSLLANVPGLEAT